MNRIYFKKYACFLFICFFIALFCSCESNRQYVDELFFDDNSQILFVTDKYIVSANPVKEENGSYSLCIFKTDIDNAKKEEVGSINYVNIYSNDYVYMSEKEIYACFSYDNAFYGNKNSLIRLVKIDLIDNAVDVIYEFEAEPMLGYIEKISEDKILLYDFGDFKENIYRSKLIIFNTNTQLPEKIKSFEIEDLKPLVATSADNNIYVLLYDGLSYKIEKYNLGLIEESVIDLKGLNYFFENNDGTISSVQYLKKFNSTFVITLFGNRSIVFTVDNENIIEEYVGERLIPWNNLDNDNCKIKGFSTGEKDYLFDIETGNMTEMIFPLASEESNSIQHTVMTFDNNNFVLIDIVKGENENYKKIFYLLKNYIIT